MARAGRGGRGWWGGSANGCGSRTRSTRASSLATGSGPCCGPRHTSFPTSRLLPYFSRSKTSHLSAKNLHTCTHTHTLLYPHFGGGGEQNATAISTRHLWCPTITNGDKVRVPPFSFTHKPSKVFRTFYGDRRQVIHSFSPVRGFISPPTPGSVGKALGRAVDVSYATVAAAVLRFPQGPPCEPVARDTPPSVWMRTHHLFAQCTGPLWSISSPRVGPSLFAFSAPLRVFSPQLCKDQRSGASWPFFPTWF